MTDKIDDSYASTGDPSKGFTLADIPLLQAVIIRDLRAENEQLKASQQHCHCDADIIKNRDTEIERLTKINEQQARKIHRLAAECVERLQDQEQLRAVMDAAREFHNFKSDSTHRVLNPTCRLCVALANF